MRDEEAKRAPVKLDWGASAWSLTDVFNAFLLREFVLEKRSRDIVSALNKDDYFEDAESLVVRTHEKLRDLIKRGNIKVQMTTELHPAVWLCLLHFIGKGAGLRFSIMETSYRKWRKSLNNGPLVIYRIIPETRKRHPYAMDVFLLQDIDELKLESPYKWGKLSAASLKSKRTKKGKEAKPLKNVGKATLEDKIIKIGAGVCRNVADMLKTSKDQHIPNLSPMVINARAKAAQGETRDYQYQGAALKLARYLKNQQDSPISKRSDAVVAKAVRLYVKCS